MSTVENYLKDLTPARKAHYARVRKIVRDLVPDAEETISYGMPTFKYKKKILLHFGAFKDHMSLFPGTRVELDDMLKDFKTSKGTIQFTEEKPIPEPIIEEILRKKMENIDGK